MSFVAVPLIVLSSIISFFVLRTINPLPKNIVKEIAFVYVLPANWSIKQDSVRYKDAVLSFRATDPESTNEMSITQQSTPEVFTDVPQYYPTLLDRLNRYKTFESANGVVYLTKPTELKGAQQAVMNSKGTLMFAHPVRNMTDDEWQRFFNSLESFKP